MKTAMQELLGLVEQMFAKAKTIEVESAMNDIINIITQQELEKEKEQIRNAYNDGYFAAYKYKDWEEYYKQNFNQNK
jgi:hypothetical protein